MWLQTHKAEGFPLVHSAIPERDVVTPQGCVPAAVLCRRERGSSEEVLHFQPHKCSRRLVMLPRTENSLRSLGGAAEREDSGAKSSCNQAVRLQSSQQKSDCGRSQTTESTGGRSNTQT